MAKIQRFTIRFEGQLMTDGTKIEAKKVFLAETSIEAMTAAHQAFAELVEQCYFPTFITGDKARLPGNSVSARVARRAGPEEA